MHLAIYMPLDYENIMYVLCISISIYMPLIAYVLCRTSARLGRSTCSAMMVLRLVRTRVISTLQNGGSIACVSSIHSVLSACIDAWIYHDGRKRCRGAPGEEAR